LNSPTAVRQSSKIIGCLALHCRVLLLIVHIGEILQYGLHEPRVYSRQIKYVA
jgi:hypothetical protein